MHPPVAARKSAALNGTGMRRPVRHAATRLPLHAAAAVSDTVQLNVETLHAGHAIFKKSEGPATPVAARHDQSKFLVEIQKPVAPKLRIDAFAFRGAASSKPKLPRRISGSHSLAQTA